jgi:hypothetical protein
MGILIARDDIIVELPETAGEMRQNTAAKLIGRQIHCKDVHGRYQDFTITDYGTSHNNGPWVKYLPRNGKEGKDEVTVAGDVMDEMLEHAIITNQT